jgi:BirA family biotin operon repressor/biotin-[acetyl-CoA-carboxylase] ligase
MFPDQSLNLAALALALGTRARRFDADLLAECDSTNAVLLARAEADAPGGTVVIAERQTAGRGRRGRAWISAPDDSLCFSLLWRFAPGTAPAGLSLAVGLAVARGIEKVFGDAESLASLGTATAWRPAPCGLVGADEATALQGGRAKNALLAVADGGTVLKWPNDLLRDGRKLGGILVELVPGAPHAAVIGIGLNLRLPAALPAELRASCAALGPCDPNLLLAAILIELLAVLEVFGAAGFAPLRADWRARHAFEDAPVRLLSDFAPPREGICRGVDADGALLLEVDDRVERVLSGEISLRGVESS